MNFCHIYFEMSQFTRFTESIQILCCPVSQTFHSEFLMNLWIITPLINFPILAESLYVSCYWPAKSKVSCPLIYFHACVATCPSIDRKPPSRLPTDSDSGPLELKTLPKAQRTRRLSSSCQSNLLRSYHKFKHKSWSHFIFRISTKHQLKILTKHQHLH